MIEVLMYENMYFVNGNCTIKFTCPYCNNDITFVKFSKACPEECRYCGSALPNIEVLVTNRRRRLNWHALPDVGFKRNMLLSGGRIFMDDFEDKRGYD